MVNACELRLSKTDRAGLSLYRALIGGTGAVARLRDPQTVAVHCRVEARIKQNSAVLPGIRGFATSLKAGHWSQRKASFGCQRTAVSLFITDMPARPRVTALLRSQRRFSDGVTAVETPFQSSGK